MLRSFEHIRDSVPPPRLLDASEQRAVVTGGGPHYRTQWHWHDCAMILVPARGTIAFRDETRRSVAWLSEDRFVVVPKMQAHESQALRQSSNHVALYLTEAALAQFAPSRPLERLVKQPSLFAATPLMRTLLRLCCSDDAGAAPKAAQDHLAAALIIATMARIEQGEALSGASRDDHGSALVAEISAFIAERLDEDVPLDELADAFGLSRRQATRLFRQFTGMSIGDYRNGQRIETARRLLADTTLPIGEIAWRTGFDSGSALARAMRRTLGEAPGALRAGLRSAPAP
ncbi:AraC family transcriptional regulator [Bosea sp. (in: a-proteobacteria)]|jgi:AraC-like DNA-binding protein|uniref:AraC family transcriptional regulator n=1 Tax=Bosea sp. (in: a-proteobacteria) TaxID=1871050 RepID=UPI002DDCE713|nr:helix-turn-helix domain-containing protein [Bosea sp. (in: a-proteobacteria)]HEV2513229.1 helix-turn-helix domain-containing protein [Bosea sp. (in: a-proteobacteria)]